MTLAIVVELTYAQALPFILGDLRFLSLYG